MKLLTSLVLSVAFLVALRLGWQMKIGKAGRGGLGSLRGLSVARTVIVALIAPILVCDIVWDDWILLRWADVSIPIWLQMVGLLLFLIGIAFRYWSQSVLGGQWSADLSIKTNHKLITAGPYAWVRHPIYTSYFFIAPGLFFTTGDALLGILACLYMLISVLRIPAEEKMLIDQFGDEYKEYKRSTGSISPRMK